MKRKLKKAISVFPAYAWTHAGSSIFCEDPYIRASERGYILK